MPTPLVAVIIPNWNLRNDLVECLESIKMSSYGNIITIVVDNGSTDDSVEIVSQKFPEVRLIVSKENQGYAGGVNLGLREGIRLGAHYFFVLNNDTVLPPETISLLITTMEQYPKYGIIAPKVLYFNSPDLTYSLGDKVFPFLPLPVPIGRKKIDHKDNEQIMDFDYLFGCALLIRKEVLESIGLFDTSYFMYYEDADYCWRARAAGFSLARIGYARIYHKGSLSVNKEKPLMIYYRARNRSRFFRRYPHGLHPIFTFIALFLGSVWKILILIISGNISMIKPYVEGVIRGLFEQLPALEGTEIE